MKRYKFSDIAYNITEKKMPVPGDEKLYIGLEHLDSGSLQVSRWGGDIELKGEKLVMRKGDILFGRRNTYLRRAAIAPHDGIFSAHGMIFRPNTDVVDPGFFPFFIASDYFMDEAIRISVGSLSPTVNWGTLKNLEFNLPDIPEQRHYAELLAAFERTKEAYKKLISATEDLVKSQFIEQFDIRTAEKKGWPIVTLDQIADVGSSKRVFVKDLKEEGIPFFRGTEVGALAEGLKVTPELFITKEHYEELKKATGVAVQGDLLLPSICPDGRIWQVDTIKPFYFKDGRVLWIHPDQTTINSTYLRYALKAIFANRYNEIASGTTFAELKIFALKALKLAIPPKEQQEHYSAYVEQSDKSKFEAQQTLKELTDAQKALMKKIFEQ